MNPRKMIHTVDVTRPTNTPDPVTKKGTPGVATIATGLKCLLEGATSASKGTSAGDFQIAAYVMSWIPVLSGDNAGPFLVADDIVTFRGQSYLVLETFDDTLRPNRRYMKCSLKAKK